MARNYQVLCPATEADGDSFDAWTARVRMMRNVEACFEEARIDQRYILPAYVSATSLIAPVLGPLPLVARFDRGGRWRTLAFSLLCCGGTGTPTLRVILTDTYRRPRTSSVFASMADTLDPYCDFAPGSGTTADWRAEQEIEPPMSWAPTPHDEPDGDEVGRTHVAWASVWITTTPTSTYARVAGLRWRELVEEEP